MELVTTNFTPEHKKITHEMVDRVIHILQATGYEVLTYGITNEYSKTESIKLKVDGYTISIQVST